MKPKSVEIIVDDMVITFVVPSIAQIDETNIKKVIEAFIALGEASEDVLAVLYDILSGKEFGLRIRNIPSQPEMCEYLKVYVDKEIERITKQMMESKDDYICVDAPETKPTRNRAMQTIGKPTKGYAKKNNWKRTRSNPKLR